MDDRAKRLKRNVLRNVYSYFVVFVLIFISVNVLLIFRFNLLFISIMFSFFMMFLGQALLLTPFSISYFFYIFSCFSVTTISVLYWIARHVPYSDMYLFIYAVTVVLLVGVPLAIHWFTRKRIGTIPMVPMFSIFFFGLLLVFGISQTIDSSTYDRLFLLTMVLFIITSIFGLNIAFRTLVLNRKLGIRDRNRYLRKTKDDLLEKYTNAHADIDLLIYYLSSSLDSFIDGDFERSFMDAYKIVFDNQSKAFKTIYVLPEDKERSMRFAEIRDNLSHAHIREKKKGKEETDKKEYLKNLKELKKRLFRDTLDLLRIVRYEFIDVALKKNKISKLKAHQDEKEQV